MAIAVPPSLAAQDRPIAVLESIWRAPLVPIALAATAGIVLDRYAGVPLLPTYAIALLGLISFSLLGWKQQLHVPYWFS